MACENRGHRTCLSALDSFVSVRRRIKEDREGKRKRDRNPNLAMHHTSQFLVEKPVLIDDRPETLASRLEALSRELLSCSSQETRLRLLRCHCGPSPLSFLYGYYPLHPSCQAW